MFSIRHLTNSGRALLNSALSSGDLIWTYVRTSAKTVAESGMESLTSILDSEYTDYTGTGQVTSVITSGDSSLSIHGELNNNEKHGTANLLGIWAKLGDSGDDTLVLVAKNDSLESPLVFNDRDTYGLEIAFVDYTLTLGESDTISSAAVASNYYASSSALTVVDDKVDAVIDQVTSLDSHVVKLSGSQTIDGAKSFSSVLVLQNGAVPPSNESTATLGTSSVAWDCIYTKDCTISGNVSFNYVSSDIIPSTGDTCNIGSSDNKFNNVYANTVYGNLAGTADSATSASTANSSTNSTYAANLGSSSSVKMSYDSSNITTYTSIIPSSTTTYNLGSSNKKFSNVYASTFNGSLNGIASQSTHSANLSNGTTSKLSASSDTVTAKVKIVPNSSGTIDLGTSTYKWGSLYVTEIPGIVSETATTRYFNTWIVSSTGNISAGTSSYTMTTAVKIANVDASDIMRRFIANTLAAATSTTYSTDSSTSVGAIRLVALERSSSSSSEPPYSYYYRNVIVSGSDLYQVSLYGSTGNMSCYVHVGYTYGSGSWLFINPLMCTQYAGYLIGLAIRIA